MKEDEQWFAPLKKLKKNHFGGMKEFSSPPPLVFCIHVVMVMLLTQEEMNDIQYEKAYQKWKKDPEKLLSTLMKIKPEEMDDKRVERIEKKLAEYEILNKQDGVKVSYQGYTESIVHEAIICLLQQRRLMKK